MEIEEKVHYAKPDGFCKTEKKEIFSLQNPQALVSLAGTEV
jgi:hypothetical protein